MAKVELSTSQLTSVPQEVCQLVLVVVAMKLHTKVLEGIELKDLQ